ncbi:MAG: hypothetical protein GY839_05095 [candidate division Zixibacteria bacterium]|nr:hypothetical protein [candidate division Zixibacteria bacterium]
MSTSIPEYKIKTFRWLFYLSCFQILVFFAVPALIYPVQILFDMEIMAALTVGVLFALFSLLVNLCGLSIDTDRKLLYIIMSVIMGGWILWASITWIFIEYMDYLLT